MSLPQNVTPDPKMAALVETVTEDLVVTKPVTTDDAVTAEDVSDAELRAWAKDNGIEDVPASGRLSAAWRENITTQMAGWATNDLVVGKTVVLEEEEISPPVKPVVEYHSVWQAPNTFVNSQAFTA